MDLNQLKKEVLETWEKHPRGATMMVFGTLVISSILPPWVSGGLGAIGIAWVVLRTPPDQGALLGRLWPGARFRGKIIYLVP